MNPPRTRGGRRSGGRGQSVLVGVLQRHVTEVRRRSRGRLWWPRALALLWMVHLAFDLWKDPLEPRGLLNYPDVFAGLNLGIHELGHAVFAPLGWTMGLAGGSILQCLVPFASLFMFTRQRDDFAVCVGLAWLGSNLFSVGVYMADARVRELPLVTPFGGHPIHDWAQLFGSMGLLRQAEDIGLAMKWAAMMSIAMGFVGGCWLVREMFRGRHESRL